MFSKSGGDWELGHGWRARNKESVCVVRVCPCPLKSPPQVIEKIRCGNLYATGVIEDLIEDVQIDALHSFQDVILPAGDFKARYGDRVAALGGVDMDKLARMDEGSLRDYVWGILKQCMPGGRFVLGSGNTVANYIPVHNYCIMLEESRRWQPSSG